MGKSWRRVTEGKGPRNEACSTEIQTWSVEKFYPGLVAPRKSFFSPHELTFKRVFVCLVRVNGTNHYALENLY